MFGKVIEGMDVVDKIADVKTGRAGGRDVPVTAVVINSIETPELLGLRSKKPARAGYFQATGLGRTP